MDEQQDNIYGISNFRISVIYIIFAAFFALLVARLLTIQIIAPERLIKEGNSRVLRAYSFEHSRGLITDRRGKILAISVPVKSVYADPKILKESKITHDAKIMRRIADILGINVKTLYKKIKNPQRRHIRLKQYLSLEKAQELQKLKVKGLELSDNYQRVYPTAAVNAQLVGLLNSEGKGVYGVEQSFNSYLSPVMSKSLAKQDLKGHIIENIDTIQQGNAGGNLMLSVDSRLQAFAYDALNDSVQKYGAESGSVVLIDVKSGEILAMVNAPSFDPNNRSVFDSDKARNRAVTDVFEPGSSVKPLVALSALEANYINWRQSFDTRPFVVDGKLLQDTHYMERGNLKEILKYSSNTGMSRIALMTGPDTILDTLARFGFGQSTQSGLVGESDGNLNRMRSYWSEIDKASLGYGYGIAVTPLQLASAYATLANFGSKVKISILRTHKQAVGVQVSNINEIKHMHQALETVVSEGTGGRASINRYRIAGKTGTAKIAGVGGYAKKQYIANFAGFAPISNPRFALVVVVNNPTSGDYSGGKVAGPIFQSLMTHALQLYNIEPDK